MNNTVRVDFHCHTLASFDGFSSIKDICSVARVNKIDAVVVMEHDRVCLTQDISYTDGVAFLRGVELTTNTGSHIGGLFVSQTTCRPTAKEAADFILGMGGRIYIPHPFKKRSGLLASGIDEQDLHYVLERSSFIEILNGGLEAAKDVEDIMSVAEKYSLRPVAGSDSHKPWHVGKYVVEYRYDNAQDMREVIMGTPVRILRRPDSGSMTGDARSKEGYWIRKVGLDEAYGRVAGLVPSTVKRFLKQMKYQRQYRKYFASPCPTPDYEEIYPCVKPLDL